MDTFDCIATKFDIREFSEKQVPSDIQQRILEAARLTGSGLNTQHWRLILVRDKENLRKLANDSYSGGWVSNAAFAIIVLTNPKHNFHMIDAGRVIQDMQLAAWNYGVASCLFTGINSDALSNDFEIPQDLNITAVVGFGYARSNPARWKKNRISIKDLVSIEKYGKAD
jgi:nitroreductase